MILKPLITLMFVMAAFVCSGQSFLSKYKKLTSRNLSEFFLDWEAYSDSVASNATRNDSLISVIVNDNYESIVHSETNSTAKNITKRYCVVPQYIEIERYDTDVKIEEAKLNREFPNYIPDLDDSQYTIDTITPVVRHKVLYINSNIDYALAKYAGGLKKGKKFGKINNKHVSELEKYIPVSYGHWGGYWWFTSFPMISYISIANNLVAVIRRMNSSVSEEIWYIKENCHFVRQPDPIDVWEE